MTTPKTLDELKAEFYALSHQTDAGSADRAADIADRIAALIPEYAGRALWTAACGGERGGWETIARAMRHAAMVRRQFPAATREGNRLLVDTVFFDSDIEADDVRRSLINHDGYPGNIEVEK